MNGVNKTTRELAVNLVEAWLAHEAEVTNEIGNPTVKGKSISVKEIAQAYLDFFYVLINEELPENLKDRD